MEKEIKSKEKFDKADKCYVEVKRQRLKNGRFKVTARAFNKLMIQVGENYKDKNLSMTNWIFLEKLSENKFGEPIYKFDSVATLEELKNVSTAKRTKGAYVEDRRNYKTEEIFETDTEAIECIQEIIEGVKELAREFEEAEIEPKVRVIVE